MAVLTKEVKLKPDVFMVLKISLDWKFTYINDAYMENSGMYEEELINQSVRDFYTDDMPKSVLRLMDNTMKQENEFSGYMKNIGKNGFYWTFTNVSPSFDTDNKLIGYFSIRRYPSPEAVELFSDLYQQMCEVEASIASEVEAMDASIAILNKVVNEKGSYNEFIFSFNQ